MPNMKVICGDFDDPRVVALLRHHLAGMHENSPPGSVFALDQTGLKAFDISFYTAWQDGELLGMGDLKAVAAAPSDLEQVVKDGTARRAFGPTSYLGARSNQGS